MGANRRPSAYYDLKLISNDLCWRLEEIMEKKIDMLTFHNTLLQNQIREPHNYPFDHDDFKVWYSKQATVTVRTYSYEDREKQFKADAEKFHPKRRYIALTDKDDVSLIQRLVRNKPGVDFIIGAAKMRFNRLSILSQEFTNRFFPPTETLLGDKLLHDQLYVVRCVQGDADADGHGDGNEKTIQIREASPEERVCSYYRAPRKRQSRRNVHLS